MSTLFFCLFLFTSGDNIQTGTCRCKFTNRQVPNDATHLTPQVKSFPWTLKQTLEVTNIKVYTLTFPSPVKSKYKCNNTVWCEYYLPANKKTPCPAAVVLHFLYDPGFKVTRLVCNYLAQQGIATLLVKMAYYGERRPENSTISMSSSLDVLVSGWTQSVQDIRCALCWLSSQQEIDSHRIGLVGTSLGALVGTLVTSVDTKISRTALILGGGNLNRILWSAPETRELRKTLKEHNLSPKQTLKLLEPIEPLRFATPLPKGALLMINGKKDRTVPPDCAKALARAYKNGETIWYDTSHTGIAVYFLPILNKIAIFLNRAQ